MYFCVIRQESELTLLNRTVLKPAVPAVSLKFHYKEGNELVRAAVFTKLGTLSTMSDSQRNT